MRTLFGRLAIGAVSILTGVVVLAQPQAAVAAAYNVYVGYSDGLRGSGFFPNPWQGDPGVTFLGSAPPYDAGAILLQNISGAALTIDSVAVSINGTPATPPWALPVTLGTTGLLILTQTVQYDFDTSDTHPISPNGVPVTDCTIHTCPTVTIGANGGASQTFSDSGHTLDTLGYDFAYNGANESFNWRLIGTCSDPGCGGPINPVPLPAAFPLFAAGLGAMGLLGRRKKRKASTAIEGA